MQFRVLGPVEVRSVTNEPVRLGPPLQVRLLAVLLTKPGATFPVDQLIEELWPERPPKSAAGNIRTYVWSLRRILSPSGAADSLLAGGTYGYRLVVGADQVDASAFNRLSHAAYAMLHRNDHAGALATFERALALWRGVPFQGLPATGLLMSARTSLDERRLTVLDELADLYLRCGRHNEIIDRLRVQVAAEPLRERPWGQLMTALARAGRQAEALAAYRELHRALARELGVEPSPDIQLLHRQILRSDLPPPAHPEPAPEGPPGVAAVPASALEPGGRPRPRQLPQGVPGFVGRTAELRQLDTVAACRTGRIAVICGMPGLGKTALAVHWAHRVSPAFPDGQLYVDLRGHGPGTPMSPLEALTHLLESLGTSPHLVPADPHRAAGLFRSVVATKRVLLLLDNAASAEQVRPLLPGGPAAFVVVTSRERLTGLVVREGARLIDLPALSQDHALALLTWLLGAGRVGAELPAARELARLCGTLPLALRIAAATIGRHSASPIAELVARLRTSSRLATLRIHGDPESAVEAAFESSYGALDPPLQHVFRRLSLLPVPDFTAAAVAALIDEPLPVADAALRRIEDAHLIEDLGNDRYGMHDLVREYAGRLAELADPPPERATALARVTDWYLRTAEAAARALYPQLVRLPVPIGEADHLDGPAAVRWLTAEHRNLVLVATSAADTATPAVTWLLSSVLRGHFMSRRDTTAWITVTRRALAAATAHGDLRAQAAAQYSLGLAYNCTGDLGLAIDHCSRAVALAARSRWIALQASALAALGVCHSCRGQTRQAIAHLTSSLKLNRSIGNAPSMAIALNNLGTIDILRGRLDRAERQLDRSLRLHARAGTRRGAASALINLGTVARHRGDLARARDLLTEARDTYRQLGDVEGAASAIRELALVDLLSGRGADALAQARLAVAAVRPTGDPQAEALALHALGSVRAGLGHVRLALSHQRRALRLGEQAGNRQAVVAALVGLAELHQRGRDVEAARRYATLAARLAQEAMYLPYREQALRVLQLTAGEVGADLAAPPCPSTAA